MATNYSAKDTALTGKYSGINEVIDFLLAHKVYPPDKKESYMEKPWKPPNNVKPKEGLKAIPELKPSLLFVML